MAALEVPNSASHAVIPRHLATVLQRPLVSAVLADLFTRGFGKQTLRLGSISPDVLDDARSVQLDVA